MSATFDAKTGVTEFGGVEFYSTRNYNPAMYTFNKMKALSYQHLITADFVEGVTAAKEDCLSKHGHDASFPMFAIEKDDEYYPEFKTCVKDSMLEAYA